MRTTMYALAGSAVMSTVLAGGMAAAPAARVPASPAAPAAAAAMMSHARLVQALQPWPVLREGSNSLWPPVTVRSLQYLLDARGARLAVDGQFGPKTKAVLIAFQRAMSTQVRGFAVDGIAGPQTWQALVTEALSG